MYSTCGTSTAGECFAERPKQEVANIFRLYGKEYRCNHALPLSHLKVMHLIEVCRTWSTCNVVVSGLRFFYIETLGRDSVYLDIPPRKKKEQLPVGYFHLVFTLPHELNPVSKYNQKVVFDILFRSVSETILQFGSNPENGLGGKLGFLCILHTWNQTLMDHIHLHCVIAGGALSFDHSRWLPARESYLFSVRALSRVFRGKFTDYMKSAFKDGKLIFPGKTVPLATDRGFSRFIDDLKKKEWVVYCKKPFAGTEQVLDYIGRYTHRVAISNHRIVDVKDDNVTFTYRDRRDGDILKEMTLKAEEFIRRFLLHVLPDGYVRIRHFGFLANRYKKENIKRCREFIGDSKRLPESANKTTQELILELTGVDITVCPCCKEGTMRIVEEISPLWKVKPQYMDSS
jgi:hypothetical protein